MLRGFEALRCCFRVLVLALHGRPEAVKVKIVFMPTPSPKTCCFVCHASLFGVFWLMTAALAGGRCCLSQEQSEEFLSSMGLSGSQLRWLHKEGLGFRVQVQG